jgi:predicted nuclease of predicted toxin-antitoxin system
LSIVRTIRVLPDQGVPRDAAALLRELGYDCTHAGEIGMSQASDQEIIAWSLERMATVVTLDADFHAILAVSGAAGPSVIRILRQGLDAFAVVELIKTVLVDYQLDMWRGSLVTIKLNKTTCHKLPIGAP